ncbi:hypothetical protein [Limnobaculum zhutongyuii]|uniref:hypothetical protein n=1 Tax=Limnobaculum zhutongyuii TaxID=2498113 RepID=UPI00143D2677|nr:hypothetical protein [Limnobaculum zhutongyuii]
MAKVHHQGERRLSKTEVFSEISPPGVKNEATFVEIKRFQYVMNPYLHVMDVLPV